MDYIENTVRGCNLLRNFTFRGVFSQGAGIFPRLQEFAQLYSTVAVANILMLPDSGFPYMGYSSPRDCSIRGVISQVAGISSAVL